MSSSTTAPAPAATTAVPPAPQGFPISEHAAQLSRIYIGATTVLMAFWDHRVGPDDYFILLGFILTITDWAMLFPTMVPHPGLLPASRTLLAGKNSWLAIGIWGLSMGCIKISIALTLLRIQGSHLGWRIFLYTTMGVCAVYGVGNVFFNLLICCRPLEKAWNFAAEGAVRIVWGAEGGGEYGRGD
ncbi:hypothetical protein N0V88_007727 [Collariella sp. IMI 366227]|nr:hypothetical protein N0V88_007727 [Collariella sp. IMI 366227]